MLEPHNLEELTMLLTREMIRRQAQPITKGLIGQGSQTMITKITYGALIVRKQDIHGSNVGNSMASRQHLAKNMVTMEDG